MLSDDNTINLNNAKCNQNKFNNLGQEIKNKWINQIYKSNNNSIPIIEYSHEDIKYSFKKLTDKQNYSIISNTTNFNNYIGYNNLVNFIRANKINNNSELVKKLNNFKNVNLIVVDLDYKKHYIEICTLSDFYQNEQRVKCKVLKYKTPYDYYKQNYIGILNKYFANQGKYYENGLRVNELSFDLNDNSQYKKSINPIYLQNIIYENNKFCTVYKPYLFKLFIQLFKPTHKPKILDLSSGWGDRLIGVLSIQDQIEKYIGIDPNERLFEGYSKMIKDLSKIENVRKFILINKPAEEVNYIELDSDIDIIFWSPPFFDLELYINDVDRKDLSNQSVVKFNKYDSWEDFFLINVLNMSSNNLNKGGIIILYLGYINFDSFLKKMNNIGKLKYIGEIGIYGDKLKKYLLFVKTQTTGNCTKLMSLTDSDSSMIIQIKKNIKNPIHNPPLNIIQLNLDNKRTINLVQDSVLIAGTKQRIACKFMEIILKKLPQIKILTYTGSYNGYGAIATAYTAYHLGLKANVFLSSVPTGSHVKSSLSEIIITKQINTLHALNASIYLCDDYKTAKNMEYDITTLPTVSKEIWKVKNEYFNVPLGLNDNDKIMIGLLSEQIKIASYKTILDPKIISNPRIWLVGGTGGIAQALNLTWTNPTIFLYLTGGGKHILKVKEWANKNKNVQILNSNPNYNVSDISNDYKKYYESVENYDSVIWTYVKKYGLDGDFIWNVASD